MAASIDEFYPDPQQEESRVVCRCEMCGEPIYEGYDFYDIEGTPYCEDCVIGCHKEATMEMEF